MGQTRRLIQVLAVGGMSALVVQLAAMRGAEGKTDGDRIERWGMFELSLKGPRDGNPFLDVRLSARFKHGDRVVEPEGFYDGNGVYRIRFMPDELGRWTYVTKSNRRELNGQRGELTCVGPSGINHGPVRVRNTYYFAYADGTPYFEIGTTCYAWAHQGNKLEEQTLATLRKAPFNKVRMCVFPKDYVYNKNEPQYYPFEGTPPRNWDFGRFNPAFFGHFEKRVGDLMKLGIEADIILFHPYDRWGFKSMGYENNVRYLRYVIARLAAYRNAWWSMANEFDFLGWPMSDWDKYFQLVRDKDPYHHLRSVHNGRVWYDHTKPWVTHASLQTSDFGRAVEWREKYKKPVVFDECRYEGNVPQGWGNISAEEMVRHFWSGTIAGCYVGHGETYLDPNDILWWSKGGVLHGKSPARIAFLKKVMEEAPPFEEMVPGKLSRNSSILSKAGEYYLIYFSSPATVTLNLPGRRPYKVDGIDTWEMTVTPVGTAGPGKFSFAPPGGDYLLRLSLYAPGEKIRPEAKASASPTEGAAPLGVQFATPSRLQCRWAFGDGAESVERNPLHIYKKAGFYMAALTVTDEGGTSATAHVSIGVLPSAPKNLKKYKTWPGSQEGLVFVWGNERMRNQIAGEDGRILRRCRVRARGKAKFGRVSEMELAGGAFLAQGVDKALLAACKKSNQLTVEGVITPDNVRQSGPARIITFSNDHSSRDFTLGQQGETLIIRVRTPRTGRNGLNPQVSLCKVKPGETVHLIVSYFPGHLYCYRNGRRIFSSTDIQGDFRNWEKCHLLFGDEWVGGRDWAGQLEGIAIYSRFMTPEEAGYKYALYKKRLGNR